MPPRVDMDAHTVDGWRQQWHKRGVKTMNLLCRICHKKTRHDLLLELRNVDQSRPPQDVYECSVCKVTWIRGDKRNYPVSDESIDATLYGMAGWGVMNLGASLAHKYGAQSFLDVGADFGLAVDIAKRAYELDAEGIEPTDAGKRAAKDFKVKITQDFMTTETDLGKSFDFIHSSEVLEHVPDPLSFLRAFHQSLTPNGLIFLTTPWAGVVDPKLEKEVVISNLSPSDHIYLWNTSAAEKLLKEAGFKKWHIEIRDGHHLYILACRSNKHKKLSLDIQTDPERTLRYLVRRSKTARSKVVKVSMLTAAFFEANNQRDYKLCAKILPKVIRASRKWFGIDLRRPEAVRTMQINKLQQYAPRFAAMCYVISTLYILHFKDYKTAIAYCELALRITDSTILSIGYGEYVMTLRGALLDTLKTAQEYLAEQLDVYA